ncbi:MAG: riboflavin synthase [Thermodesulfobacteriota bacterium]
MFTGIIEEIGTVKSIEKRDASGKISIVSSFDLASIKEGESVAVDGVCLTVTGKNGGARTFTADLSAETLRTTTIGKALRAGCTVNLERALTPGRPMGGHFVTGHIDAVGLIKKRVEKGEFVDLEVELPGGLTRQVAKKGSIAVDGISLTVRDLSSDVVKFSIVPHTLKCTTLSEKSQGAAVNVETDILAKYVERVLAKEGKKGVSADFLAEHGFLNRE